VFEVTTVQVCIPEKRYAEQTEQTNGDLKVDPVVHQPSQQRVEARSDRPEVLDDCSSERAISSREKFTRHHETWQNYALTTNRDDIFHFHRRQHYVMYCGMLVADDNSFSPLLVYSEARFQVYSLRR